MSGSMGTRCVAGVFILAVVASAGCASGTSGGGAGSAGSQSSASSSARGSYDVLTGDELRETPATNLWDALRQLRPQWLRARANTSLVAPAGGEEPVVYLNGVPYGAPRTLQGLNIDQVRRVEFVDGRDATTRFGTGYGGGVIMVDTDRN